MSWGLPHHTVTVLVGFASRYKASSGGEGFGSGREETGGRGGELGVLDGRAVSTHVNGVHHGQSAAYAKDEAEEDADHQAGEEVHNDLNGTLCATQRW